MASRPSRRDVVSVRAGATTLLLGILFLAATVFTYVLSLTDLINPPNWVRAVGLAWLPIGLVGTPIAYVLARTGPGRHQGRVGLAVALVALPSPRRPLSCRPRRWTELGRGCGFGVLSPLLPLVVDAGAAAGTVAWLARSGRPPGHPTWLPTSPRSRPRSHSNRR